MSRLLTKLGLVPDDASRPEDELLARVRPADDTSLAPAALSRMLLDPFESTLRALAPRITPLDPGLEKAVDKTRGTVEMAISKLTEKYERARLHQDQALVEEVRRVAAALQPNGAPQERVYGLAYYAARYGERALIEQVLSSVVPFDPVPRDIRPT